TSFRRYGIALSLANLVFIRQWSDILSSRPYEAYYENLTAYPTTVWALYAAVAALSFLLFGVFRLCQLAGAARLGYLVFFLAGIFSFNGLRLALNEERLSWGFAVLHLGTAAVWVAVFVGAGIVTIGLWRYKRFSFAAIDGVLSVFVLMLPINIVRSLPVVLAAPQRAPRALPHAERIAPQRIFWLVFDGLDYRATFPDRPDGLTLPNLDALRKHSDFYTDARPPGIQTNRSLPGYLMGRKVTSDLLPTSEGTFELGYSGKAPSTWSVEDTVFARAHDKGAHSAIVGWHLPYCELLGKFVDSCRRYPHYDAKKYPYDDKFWPSFRNFFTEMLQIRWRDTYVHVANYQAVLQDTLDLIEDRSVDLVFVHWPIPHNPVIFDGKRVSRNVPNFFEGHYKNLKLADLALGRVVEKLKATGQWGDAALFVTSDHPSRAILLKDKIEDLRIPLFIKNPKQRHGKDIATRTESAMLYGRALDLIGAAADTLASNL
ncbi:MAG: sulfatase-like hydrolase/transferase, partial [Bdellovibrionales bacterium]|nr:sulfatase-like hydrolase/transferase [Bdellovibrionales bacterium]